MKSALSEFKVEGVANNISFLRKILNNDLFKSGEFDTSFIEANRNYLLN